MSVKTETIRVTHVEALEGFALRLHFNDSSERTVNLEEELWGPMFEPLKADLALFRQVRVDQELGTIVWPNGADMDPDVLHGTRQPA